MPGALRYDFIAQLIVFQLVILLVVFSNLWLITRARRHPPPRVRPFVSLLVPARNEERNIARCVRSLLAQDYPSFEVLVLDDQSSDRTLAILQEIAAGHPTLLVLSGGPPPAGCSGKAWACAQLARQSRGELLLFTDADTIFQPNALREIVTAFLGEQADLLTGFPRQEVRTWGERLVVPFFAWASLCFMPLALAYRVRMPALSSAVGQMMLFRREAYQAAGGHLRVAGSIVEDLALARQMKAGGQRWRVASIADLVACRMYHSSREAFAGFAKNYFAAFDFRLLPFLFVFGWLAAWFWGPPFMLSLEHANLLPAGAINTARAWLCIALSLLVWLVPYHALRIPRSLALLYLLTVLAVLVVGLNSLFDSLSGRLHWKDRTFDRPRWRWL